MATWRAKCWLGQSVGYQELEVQSNTLNGAKQQLENVYGATQIINLHQVNSHSSSSSGGDSSSGGAMIVGAVLLLGVIVTYWYYAIPAIIILSILYYMGTRDDD